MSRSNTKQADELKMPAVEEVRPLPVAIKPNPEDCARDTNTNELSAFRSQWKEELGLAEDEGVEQEEEDTSSPQSKSEQVSPEKEKVSSSSCDTEDEVRRK